MDEEIEQRLKNLDASIQELAEKNRSKNLQKEIELRLAKLNERDPNFYSGQEPPVKLLSIKKHRTAVEETDELLKQFMEEISLDSEREQNSAIKDQELEERLQRLVKAQAEIDIKTAKSKINKFKQTGRLVHQLMMNSAIIRERCNKDDDNIECILEDDDDIEDNPMTDEMDWCTTCNENGVLRCIDCDNDIYCSDCFR